MEKPVLKDMKILIPEIPVEWTQRTRSGNTNIFNDGWHGNGLPEVSLDPPIVGLYAERFEDGWHWVCGCHKCLGIKEFYSYIVCYDHDRCLTCGTHRTELKERSVWGHPDGFNCKTCVAKAKKERKREALKQAKENGHSEYDCQYTDKIICPRCASEYETDENHDQGEHEITCDVCDTKLELEVEYEPRYTTRKKGK